MSEQRNLVKEPADILSVAQVFVCVEQACKRTIVEYGQTESSKHSKGLAPPMLALLSRAGLVKTVSCDHHGGQPYELIATSNRI